MFQNIRITIVDDDVFEEDEHFVIYPFDAAKKLGDLNNLVSAFNESKSQDKGRINYRYTIRLQYISITNL